MSITNAQVSITNAQVSIIMPAYNAADFIGEAIDSVLAQSFTNWELIIVNDCSSDNTAQIVKSYVEKSNRIKLVEHEHNQGVAAARNHALASAKGNFIAFLDSDDYWARTKLEKQLTYMEEKNAAVCYSYYQRIDEKGNQLGLVKPPESVSYRDLLKSNFIGNLTGMYNAEVLGKTFFKKIKHEDYVAWLSLLKQGYRAYCVQEVLAYYRVYAQSVSSNKLKTITWQWKIYRNEERLGFIESIYLMACYAFYALYKRA